MKVFLGPIVVFTVVFGGMAHASHSLSEPVNVKCELHSTTADGNTFEKVFQILKKPEQGGILVSEDFPVSFAGNANLHIYYDGKFSSINVFHERTDTYFNADAEIGGGHFFSLFSRPVNHPVFSTVRVSCKVSH